MTYALRTPSHFDLTDVSTFDDEFHKNMEIPREDAGGLSREYILRIPSVS